MEQLTYLIEKAELILQKAMPAEPSEPLLLSQPVTAEDKPPNPQNPEATDDDLTQTG